MAFDLQYHSALGYSGHWKLTKNALYIYSITRWHCLPAQGVPVQQDCSFIYTNCSCPNGPRGFYYHPFHIKYTSALSFNRSTRRFSWEKRYTIALGERVPLDMAQVLSLPDNAG
jgi:hypothetical protein